MKKNMGTIDRVVRILLALGVAVMYLGGVISGGTAAIPGVLAIILGVTGLLGSCPLYLPFRFSTKKAANAA